MTAVMQREEVLTLADMCRKLGGVPLDRIRVRPAPGTAVEQDVLDLHDRENRLFELVDGVLVEKPTGFRESRIAVVIAHLLDDCLERNGAGIVAGADAMMRLAAGLVRIPDVSAVLWSRLPGRRIPREPIPDLAPDLAVEVLSPSNTPEEMDRKVREYFDAGTQLVWLVDPDGRTVRVHHSPEDSQLLRGADRVSGALVLPHFFITVQEIFRRSGLVEESKGEGAPPASPPGSARPLD